MKLYGKPILRKGAEKQVRKGMETRDAIIWNVLPAQRLCRVRIQGSSEDIVAWYPENWEQTPSWVKKKNCVKITHTGGARGRIEIVSHGGLIPTPVAGEDAEPADDTADDAVITKCNVIPCPNDLRMAVLVKTGTFRISGSALTLGGITMTADSDYEMGMGGKMGEIAGALEIDAAPSSQPTHHVCQK